MQIIPVAQKKKSDFINAEYLSGIIVRSNSSISGVTLQIRRNFLLTHFAIEWSAVKVKGGIKRNQEVQEVIKRATDLISLW